MTTLRVEVIAIFGPTASGKSAVAAVVAERLGTEVVSADALQVYRGLEILTNHPAEPTRLVAIRDLADTMSVGEYATLAHGEIDRLVGDSGVAIVAGGTGLYLRAALTDLGIPSAVATDARQRWERLYDEDVDAAVRTLGEVDPRAAAAVHRNDRRRVVRALELAEAGASLVPDAGVLWSADARRPTLLVGLDVSPDELGRRIEARTDEMLARGVVNEVREALDGQISHTARQALGLDELASLPPGEARERLVVRTRQFAAYQRKWMRRMPGVVHIDGEQPSNRVADAILDVARAG
jgi:tRNA dimethylallyltransferase